MAHVFISYAKKDTRSLADNMYSTLNAVPGLTAWMDVSLETGRSWARQIQREIDKADFVLVLLSPDVNREETPDQPQSFVLNEIHYSQQEHKPIILAMAQRTRVPVELAGTQYLDVTRDADSGIDRLTEEVCRRARVESPKQRRANEEAARKAREDEERRQRDEAERRVREDEQRRQAEAAALLKAQQEEERRKAAARRAQEAASSVEQIPSSPKLGDALSQRLVDRFGNRTITYGFGLLALLVIAVLVLPRLGGGNTPIEVVLQVTQTASPAVLVEATEAATEEAITEVTAEATEEAIAEVTAAATAEATQEVLAGFTPVTRNADWMPVEQDFDGVTMVLVPAGCFDMGSNEGDDDEKPVNRQCFDAPFWIDKYEVTQKQFADLGGLKEAPNAYKGNNRPVERIYWSEARAFCQRRDARLPNEREWEYATRGPDNLIYPWGSTPPTIKSSNQTYDVGSYPEITSWVGAMDLYGNVMEWLSTLYGIDNGNDNYSQTGEIKFTYPYIEFDGREGQAEAKLSVHILRGGSWNYPLTSYSRVPLRDNYVQTFAYTFGFRCARDYE